MDPLLISEFRKKIHTYSSISDSSFEKLLAISTVINLKKNEVFIEQGSVCRQFCFLHTGYMVAYIHDEQGRSYNKNIFGPTDWVSSLVSALSQQPSQFTIKAVTNCVVVSMPYQKWRALIFTTEDLKLFYLHYLEKNWVIDKEKREVSIVMESAQLRYEQLLQKQPNIEQHVPLQDIASHLGITPTQLSRIRKQIK